jgi:hypothetical protein
MTYDEVAEATGYSRENVRTVLRDPRAQQAAEVLRKRILGGAMSQIEERMGGLGIQALKNIATTINTTVDVGTRAKKHQDDVSFELLARIGFGRKESDKEAGGIHLPKEEAQQLVAAIEKSNTARRIVMEAEAVEIVEVNSEDVDGNGSGTD